MFRIFILAVSFVLFYSVALAQGDFLDKGKSGFEVDGGIVHMRDYTKAAMQISFSIDGEFDVGCAYMSEIYVPFVVFNIIKKHGVDL